ncbi:MAG: hypothetical protein V4547_16985 [Bacteroidota bacterium]
MENQINIIYDERHIEDYARLLEEFIGQSVVPKYKFWNCIINKDSVVKSINASHKMIVNWAKDNKLPYVIIAEQDLHLTCPTSWEYFLKNKPKSYDLYLGCSYIKNQIPNSDVVENLICGFHLYIVNSNYFDTFLSVQDDQHIDVAIGDLKGNFVFCKPFPALQRIGFSANNKMIVDYNKVLQEEDIYRG